MSKAVKNTPIKDNIYFFDKNTKETKSKFDIISRDLRYILRAPDPKKLSATPKSLSRGAQTLLVNYYDMINKAPNKAIFVSHEFISSITVVGNSQNKRYHNELKDLFNIQYHQSVIIDGKKYRDGFAIEFTENAENILKNPKLFYSTQNAENEQLSVQKRTPRCSKKDASLYIDKENPLEDLKDRSIEIEEKIPSMENEETRSNFEKNILEKEEKVRTLKDFHPLSQDDCYRLQQLSKRSFTLNAMNEILLDMSRDVPAVFNSKQGFFAYFKKALIREKRDVFKTATESFRIKANITPEEKEFKERNKYLEQMENSNDPFKKFIASRFSERKAYDFLTSFRSIEIKNNVVQIYLNKDISLTEVDQKLILEQVKFTHKVPSKKIDFGTALAKMLDPNQAQTVELEKIELISKKPERKMQHNNLDSVILQKFGSVKGQDIIKNCSIKKLPTGKVEVQNKFSESLEEGDKDLLKTCIKQVYGENIPIIAAKEKFYSSDENELWKQFKDFLKKQFKSDKDAEIVIATWFAKLKRSQNIGSNKLILTGSPFIISWIEGNYSGLIDSAVKELKINIEFIYENNSDRPILYESGIGKFKRMDEETMNRLMSQPLFHTGEK